MQEFISILMIIFSLPRKSKSRLPDRRLVLQFLTRSAGVVLISIFFAVMFVSASSAGVKMLTSAGFLGQGSDPGWWVSDRNRDLNLQYVRRDGPAGDALRVGDRLLSINSLELDVPAQVVRVFQQIQPGSTYSIAVDRAGEKLEFTLKTSEFSRLLRAFLPITTLILPAIFLFIGLAVFLLKPYDKLSCLLALMFGTSGGLFVSGSVLGASGPMRVVIFMATVLSSCFWPIFLHFFLIFPHSREVLSPVLQRFPRLEYLLYIPHVVLTLPYSLAWDFYRTGSPDELMQLVASYPWLAYIAAGLPVLYISGGLVSLNVNYQRASALLRRKMRVVVAGSIVSLAPMLALIALGLLYQDQISESVLMWLAVIAAGAFAIFPLSFLYAIARHQVIPVRLILRRGVRYLFVARGSIVLELLAVVTVLTLALQFVFTRFELGPLQVGLLSGLISILVWQIARVLHHRVIAPLIDRRFFRQAYNAQQILSDLGQALRLVASVDEATFATISERFRAALNAENVSIFIHDKVSQDYSCIISSQHRDAPEEGTSVTPGLSLPASSFLIQRLNQSVRPLRVDFEDPASWFRSFSAHASLEGSQQAIEIELLTQLRSALFLPIATKEQFIGFMSLGPRLGDLPYAREDEQLLSAVTWQVAYAIENAHLVERRAEEDRLQREIAFATEVQRRLFPQAPPTLRTLELSGVCHPASGVGGDYYDFLLLGNGQIGIAVADVSGKGLSAALLMSTVQASLRTQASFAQRRITELVASMNRLLCESTDLSHYATFFYGEYDETSRSLTYVNAGHNPPMLFRRLSSLTRAEAVSQVQHGLAVGTESLRTASGMKWTQLLETGGPVIGLLRESIYEHETLEMLSGDVLIAYTDGVSEALNPLGEEFGEERLGHVVAANVQMGAEQICEQIVRSVDEWCQGTALHDDLTLVVMKVKEPDSAVVS